MQNRGDTILINKEEKSKIINEISKVDVDDPKKLMYDPWNGKSPEHDFDIGYSAMQTGPYVYNLKSYRYDATKSKKVLEALK